MTDVLVFAAVVVAGCVVVLGAVVVAARRADRERQQAPPRPEQTIAALERIHRRRGDVR